MPSTRARISAIRDAAVRPDNSVSTVMARGAKMRTPTSGTCGGGADGGFLQADSASVAATAIAQLERSQTEAATTLSSPLSAYSAAWLRTWQRLPLKRCISSEVRHRLLHAKHTAPTGARAVPPPGPATPVMESATRA